MDLLVLVSFRNLLRFVSYLILFYWVSIHDGMFEIIDNCSRIKAHFMALPGIKRAEKKKIFLQERFKGGPNWQSGPPWLQIFHIMLNLLETKNKICDLPWPIKDCHYSYIFNTKLLLSNSCFFLAYIQYTFIHTSPLTHTIKDLH